MRACFSLFRRPFGLAAFAGLVLSAGCTRTVGPKGLSESAYTATQKAVDALERASQSRNSSADIFERNFKAASEAADDLYNEMGNQTADGEAVYRVRTCIDDLKLYRSTFDSRESASRPIEDQLKGLTGTQMKDAIDVVDRKGKDVDDCITSAKAFL